MPFQKGESGNPAGRPRGARNRTTILLQNLLADDAEAIARKAIDMAKDGDIAAIRICMERLAPARRTEPVVLDLPPLGTAADTVDAAATIVAAAAAWVDSFRSTFSVMRRHRPASCRARGCLRAWRGAP